MAEFTITGVKALDRKLRQLEPKVARKVIRQALRKALRPVQARVKQLAPVGETGQLKRAVKIRAARSRRRGEIKLRVVIGKDDFTGTQFYSSFTEYGSSKQPAQHFMRRAFDSTKDEAKRTAISEIRAGIEREAKS